MLSEIKQTQKGKWHGLTRAQASPGSTFLLCPWTGATGTCSHAWFLHGCWGSELRFISSPLLSASALLGEVVFSFLLCLVMFRYRLVQCYICSQCLVYSVAEVCSLGMTSCTIQLRMYYLGLCKYTLWRLHKDQNLLMTQLSAQSPVTDCRLRTEVWGWTLFC